MKKQLVYSTEDYYYNKLDEDGLPVYEEYGEEYDNWLSSEDFESLFTSLDFDKKHGGDKRNFAKVKVYGSLGLWDGRHDILPVECDTYEEAIQKCINNIDSFEIYQAGRWTLYIDAHHHDGTNHFKLTCYA